MTPEERAAAFNKAAREAAKALPRIQRDALKEIVRQLQAAEKSVIAALQANPSESATRRLRQLRDNIEQVMHGFKDAATAAANGAADSAWQAAINAVSMPMSAAGITGAAVGLGPARIDARALMAAKQFMTHRIEGLSTRTLNQLNAALMQHLIGTESLADTITRTQRLLHGAARSRAMTVVYTEVGRAYSVAHQNALDEAATRVPNLKKRWLKSGKLHPRIAHVEANGQTVKHDKPFIVDGEQLMYPRDPNGSAGNTINCGCHSVPVVDESSFA